MIAPDPDGLLRSPIFPGLWLDPAGLLDNDADRVVEVLSQGLKSPEHERFVEALALWTPTGPPSRDVFERTKG